MGEKDEGDSYPSRGAAPVDDWSERVYRTLEPWSLARQGQWTRWEPGYVLLTVEQIDGQQIDPITLYTADEEITVSFGYWETHTPAPDDDWDADPEVIADHAKRLIEQWLHRDVRTAVFMDAQGKWCGSIIIEPGELLPQLQEAARHLRDFQPTTIEVRTPYRHEWQQFPVEPEWRLSSV